jgi:hypothetical protein
LEENAVGMEGDTEGLQECGELSGIVAGDGHAPGQGGKPKFDAELRRPRGVGQRFRKKCVVMNNERAFIEAQSVEQLLRSVKSQNADIVPARTSSSPGIISAF